MNTPTRPEKLDRTLWLERWDKWRASDGSWPRESFESLLDYFEELE